MWVEKCYVNMSLERPQMLAAQMQVGRNATFAMQNNFWKMWTIGFKAVLVNDKYQISVGFGQKSWFGVILFVETTLKQCSFGHTMVTFVLWPGIFQLR